jgi:adenosylhomocysteine nucleosidase
LRILLAEDDGKKAEKITALISGEIDLEIVEIVVAVTVNDAILELGKGRFDLVIVDLVMPQHKNGTDVDATCQWCELIENHLSGRTSSWIVMTGYPEVAESARSSFARHNVAVIQFDETENWKQLLAHKLKENFITRPIDFLIICALEKERKGFQQTNAVFGASSVIKGLDCLEVKIGELRGNIVVQPGPGMISSAITTTRALEIFRPQAVAMSGICGGREGETELGALIVPDISWNYQSGKFVGGKLTPDLLQVGVPPHCRTVLSQMATEDLSKELRKGLLHSEIANAPIQIRPMVTGSYIVADAAVGDEIGTQGRKVAGIDMEVASVFFAAHDFFDGSGITLAAKTVVDLANPHKDDRYHEYGCALSARFVVKALEKLLAQKSGYSAVADPS